MKIKGMPKSPMSKQGSVPKIPTKQLTFPNQKSMPLAPKGPIENQF